jgi:DNA-binding transcriptional MerR regulator
LQGASEGHAHQRCGGAIGRTGEADPLLRSGRSADSRGRDANGYRIFDERNVHELRFIKRARSLGFPIKEIDELLKLWRDKSRPSRKVRALADRHKQAVVARMQAHRSIVKVLTRLIEACKGDDRPDCPILDELSSGRGRRV